MTQGNPAKLILLFTLPLLVGNLFQQLYSMADTLIVGRTIGVNALASVGCTGSLSFLIIGFAQGLTSGLSIITAQRFGAGDAQGVRKSAAVSALVSAVIAVILTLASTLFARPLLQMMRTPPEIIEDAYRYIVIIFWGIAASILFNLLSNIIRALGDSRTPLVFLIIACVINIVLDFVLILAFKMGVAGAAVATVVAQLVSGALCVVYIVRKLPILHMRREDFHPAREDLMEHLRVGLPMGFQSSIIAIGALILQSALNGLGATAVGAYTAAQKIDQIATQPMMSFGVTMSTYAAQNYGANDIARIRRGVRQCIMMSVGFSVFMSVVNITLGHFLVGLFVGDADPMVTELAQTYLTVNGAAYFVLALLFIFRYTLQGLGKSFIPTFAGIMELCMRTAAALLLSVVWGFAGVCMANPAAWLGACVPLGVSYFRTIRRLGAEQEAQVSSYHAFPAADGK